MMQTIIAAIKNVWEKVKQYFNKICSDFKEYIEHIYSKININDRFSYNLNKALFSKKKRVRVKYMKLLFRTN